MCHKKKMLHNLIKDSASGVSTLCFGIPADLFLSRSRSIFDEAGQAWHSLCLSHLSAVIAFDLRHSTSDSLAIFACEQYHLEPAEEEQRTSLIMRSRSEVLNLAS